MCISDHYGVLTNVVFDANPEPNEDDNTTIDLTYENNKVYDRVLKRKLVDVTPSPYDNMRKEEALQKLSKHLPEERCRLYTIGSYAMGTHGPNSDIDCVCVGNFSREYFEKHCKRKLTKAKKIVVVKVVIVYTVNCRL